MQYTGLHRPLVKTDGLFCSKDKTDGLFGWAMAMKKAIVGCKLRNCCESQL